MATPIADLYTSTRSRSYLANPSENDGQDSLERDLLPADRNGDGPENLRSDYAPDIGRHARHGALEYVQHLTGPPMDEDQRSGNSSSSGTKVGSINELHDSRSPLGYKVRDGYGLGSGGSDHYFGEHDSLHSPLYPASPISPPAGGEQVGGFGEFGNRYRQESLADSGFGSNRASTIGTEGISHMINSNSSQMALNGEWRSSAELHDGIIIAPSSGRFYGQYGSKVWESSEAIMDEKAYTQIPPSSPSINFDEKRATPNPEKPPLRADGKVAPEPAIILSRANRMAWIDGLRGIASVMIFTHHFSDLTWSDSHPDTLEQDSLEGFVRNGQLAVGIYFLLGGRVLAHSFLRSAYNKARPKPNADGTPSKPTGPKWLSLSSSLFRRSIRLAFPAIMIGFIQWRLSISGIVNEAPVQAVEQVLSPSSLWLPAWGNIGDFWGFCQFCLDLFTNTNSMYMLSVGSALWTTYFQFWGSVYVYIVAAVVATLPFRGRQVIYGTLAISLWFINSPNFLYLVGLWLSDLHACGAVRKIQDHWMPTLGIELAFAAVALAIVGGGRTVGTPGTNALASITVYQGKFGFNPQTNWPQLMFLSNWFPAVAIMCQDIKFLDRFISWRIFVWLGKVSYGFYLCQFLVFYGILPHLVLLFARQGKTFWSIIGPTYILCLMTNIFLAWVAYHLLDRVGLKLGKWIWDGLFVTKPKNASALPLKMVRAFGKMFVRVPGQTYSSVTGGASSRWTRFREDMHTVAHWRTPVARPPVPNPTDPDMLAQLHSTRWTADLSQDREARRTYRLLRWQQYSWIPHMFLIPGITFVWTYFHPTGRWTFDAVTFSTLWRFIWILSVPNCLAALLGFLTPDWAPSPRAMEKKPVTREYMRNFFILLVTKGSNETAVRRGYNYLLKLEKCHPAIKVIVLTDEPYVYPDLKNIVCPKSYRSPLGKAKYKARALDYFRYHVSLGVYDWILHCDEESTCDAETIRRCFEFIRYTSHHFGQGIILYNGEGYWDNWLFTVADGIRVGDDLARFHFANSVVKRPIFGVHGSFLMTNGEMENECTWDFGSLAEDFEFSQDAWRRGFTCGRIHGVVREQSPTTVRDFMRQRRRWFMGIRDIKGMYGLPHLAINLWVVGVLTLAVTFVNFPFIALDYSLTPLWIAIGANFCFITFFSLYLWGLLFQELDYGQPWWKIIVHLTCAIPIQPFASIMEGMSAIWALSSADPGRFEVIQKR